MSANIGGLRLLLALLGLTGGMFGGAMSYNFVGCRFCG
jgi:hypothetical protein